MKQALLLFICIISFAFNGNAQSEFSSKFKAIPPVKFPATPKKVIPPASKDIPSIKSPNVFKNPAVLNQNTNKSYQLTESKPFSMIKKNDFVNPGDVYKEKMVADLNKTLNENNAPLLKKNFDFGDYKTKSEYLIVKYRDYIYVDGDLLRVYQNYNVIRSELFLEGTLKEIKIVLNPGINKVEFEALNTGTSGGNTAEIQIYDDKNNLITNNFWDNLAAGFKGSIIMVKE
jgi:hypothetical protein|nr:hypothetical protein [uncultured Flavobacterium sp.]